MCALTFENAATMASVMSAAASAYSDSSSPLSSPKKFLLITPSVLRDGGAPDFPSAEVAARTRFALLDVAGEIVDDAADVRAQHREDPHDRQGDECRRDRVLGKFESALVAKEIPD